ncbi:MAG: hypothetical protein QXO69_02850 [archaeon]
MPRLSKRKLVFASDSEINYHLVKKGAVKDKKTLEDYLENINKRREAIGKPPIYPSGSMSLLNKKLFVPTPTQAKIINFMANRVAKKGKFKSLLELWNEMGGRTYSSLSEHITELGKKGFPVDEFFEKKKRKVI